MFLLRTELLKELFIFLQGQHKCPLIGYGHSPTLNAPLLIKKNRKKKCSYQQFHWLSSPANPT